MKDIKAVIFDFGDVIYKVNCELIFNRLAFYTKVRSSAEIGNIIYAQKGPQDIYETGFMSTNGFIKTVTDKCSLIISKQNFIDAYVNIFSPIQESIDLIKRLKTDYKLGLLSNTNELHFENYIKKIEIFDLFDAVTLSYKEKAMKPERKIYQAALNSLNLTADECVFIDNNADNVRGAREAGITSIQYTEHGDLVKKLQELGVKV